jgi:hypothetical protein
MSNSEETISEMIYVMDTLEILSLGLSRSYGEECEVVEKIAQNVSNCATAIRGDLEDLREEAA